MLNLHQIVMLNSFQHLFGISFLFDCGGKMIVFLQHTNSTSTKV